jgi:hypothetical protein
MIFQIAAGVCIGIVLAVVILNYWRQILSLSITAAFWLVVVAVALAAIVAVVQNQTIRLVAAGFGCLLVLPSAILEYFNRRYPDLAHGRPPWNRGLKAFARLLVVVGALGCGVSIWVVLLQTGIVK